MNQKKGNNNHKNNHPSLKKELTFGQKASDVVTSFAGSWTFIIIIGIILVIWMVLNVYLLVYKWDPYPFILLNFVLSTLAALQAPIILMSQNRQAERDRINARYDYLVNRKAEREICKIQKDLRHVREFIKGKVK